MQVKRWVLVALLLGSATVGAGAIIASNVIYHHTSNNAFCTSCHSMAIQADDAYFKRSAHRSNSKGVIASCGDCHIPKTNWFVETYVKATSGARDVFSELTHNFKDPKVWAAHRVKLTEEAQARMRRWDSVTCRGCHDANAISPKSEDGRTSHATLKQGGVTCASSGRCDQGLDPGCVGHPNNEAPKKEIYARPILIGHRQPILKSPADCQR